MFTDYSLINEVSVHLDLQFVFLEKNVGCTSAIFTVRSVIEYYNKRGSTVNLRMLDVSKAFDRVNHYGVVCS